MISRASASDCDQSWSATKTDKLRRKEMVGMQDEVLARGGALGVSMPIPHLSLPTTVTSVQEPAYLLDP